MEADYDIATIRETFLLVQNIQGVPKNALSERYWSYSALAQSPFAGTSFVWRLIFWSFLTKTNPQVMSMVKFSPIAINFGYDFVLVVLFWDTL